MSGIASGLSFRVEDELKGKTGAEERIQPDQGSCTQLRRLLNLV